MAGRSGKSSKMVWIVGGIWGLALILGAVILLGLNVGFVPFSGNLAGAQPPFETLEFEPVVTFTPRISAVEAGPDADSGMVLNPTETLAMIPTQTPGPTPTPIIFPTMRATSDALWEGPLVIGYSVQDRPIEVWRFGQGPRKYLIVAGIHGGYEINTIELADQLISYFSKRPQVVPSDATLFILRSLNPDGEQLEHKKEGRGNAHNVDLNRSFPTGWEPVWDRDGCWDLLELNAGQYPASEPETVALMAFVLENPVIAVISYHSAAPGFYPAGEPLDPSSVALSEYLSRVTGYPYPAYYTGCYMTGSLVDWTLTTGAAGADVELSTHWDTEFDLNLNLVLALLRWMPPEE
ncbi:MAG: hypothetical protein JW757_00830 [Anaerolineales bacterium]|nr:hypothetical protein [Anaerolineales bacterium]